MIESLSCPKGKQADPVDSNNSGPGVGELPPCFQMPASGFSGTQFPLVRSGHVYLKAPPNFSLGPSSSPANPATHP